jgi:hypothetical protein
VVSFLQASQPKCCMHPSLPQCAPHAPPPHLILLVFITLTMPAEEYKPCSSSLCSFLQPPVTLSLFGSKYSPKHPVRKHPQSTSRKHKNQNLCCNNPMTTRYYCCNNIVITIIKFFLSTSRVKRLNDKETNVPMFLETLVFFSI